MALVLTLAAIAVILGIVALVARQSAAREPSQISYTAMGTGISSTIYCNSKSKADDLNQQCKKAIDTLEQQEISWRIPDSDIAELNRNGSGDVSPDTAKIIRQCLDVSQNCGGCYDITIGKLTILWNIGTSKARVPSQAEIEKALPFVNYQDIRVNGTHITLGKGQFLDLGGIGKGYAADKCQDILKKNGAEGAAIAVGGSVLLYGKNPGSKDGTWNVGIQDPGRTHNDTCMTFRTGPCFVSTSGDYEKVLTVDGKSYHHILNPKTGYPAETNVTSTTVVTSNGALSDALSTACFIYGYSAQSLKLLKHYGAEGVFILKDGTIYATPGIRGKLTLTNQKDFRFAS